MSGSFDRIGRWIPAACFLGVLMVCLVQFLISFGASHGLDRELRMPLVEEARKFGVSSEGLEPLMNAVADIEERQIRPLKLAIASSIFAGIGLSFSVLLKPRPTAETAAINSES